MRGGCWRRMSGTSNTVLRGSPVADGRGAVGTEGMAFSFDNLPELPKAVLHPRGIPAASTLLARETLSAAASSEALLHPLRISAAITP